MKAPARSVQGLFVNPQDKDWPTLVKVRGCILCEVQAAVLHAAKCAADCPLHTKRHTKPGNSSCVPPCKEPILSRFMHTAG